MKGITREALQCFYICIFWCFNLMLFHCCQPEVLLDYWIGLLCHILSCWCTPPKEKKMSPHRKILNISKILLFRSRQCLPLSDFSVNSAKVISYCLTADHKTTKFRETDFCTVFVCYPEAWPVFTLLEAETWNKSTISPWAKVNSVPTKPQNPALHLCVYWPLTVSPQRF